MERVAALDRSRGIGASVEFGQQWGRRDLVAGSHAYTLDLSAAKLVRILDRSVHRTRELQAGSQPGEIGGLHEALDGGGNRLTAGSKRAVVLERVLEEEVVRATYDILVGRRVGAIDVVGRAVGVDEIPVDCGEIIAVAATGTLVQGGRILETEDRHRPQAGVLRSDQVIDDISGAAFIDVLTRCTARVQAR